MFNEEYLIEMQYKIQEKGKKNKVVIESNKYFRYDILDLQEDLISKKIPLKGIENLLPEGCNLDLVSGEYYPHRENTTYKDAKPIYKSDLNLKIEKKNNKSTKYDHLSVA